MKGTTVATTINDIPFKKISDLTPGESVDLEGDVYADPEHINTFLQYSYATVVESIEEEVDGFQIVTVTFMADGSEMVVVFPPDHEVLTVELS